MTVNVSLFLVQVLNTVLILDSAGHVDKTSDGFRPMSRPLVLQKAFRYTARSAAAPCVTTGRSLIVLNDSLSVNFVPPQSGGPAGGASGAAPAAVAGGRPVFGRERRSDARLLHPDDAPPGS